MNTTIQQQVTAFSLAALTTLAILGSINVLATQPAPEAVMAAAQVNPVQVVVIEGKRLAHS